MKETIEIDLSKKYEITTINGSKKSKVIKDGDSVHAYIASVRGHFDKIEYAEILIAENAKNTIEVKKDAEKKDAQ